MSEIKCLRRYYLLKRLNAARLTDDSEGIWKGKQEEIDGSSLPSDFPLRAELVAIGYSTTDDLDGADAPELLRSGFTAEQTERILAALAPLI